MATIERDVSLLQRRRVAPIYIVYGSAVQIKLNMIDYTIPENATVEFFAQCGNGPVYRADGSATGNSAVFTPQEGFFQQGDNALQLEINGRLIPLALDVKCEERISGVGSEETPEQVRPLVLQAQDAAQEASLAAVSSAGSAESAGQSANAAAGSAGSAAESAKLANESKTAAAESARVAREAMEQTTATVVKTPYIGDNGNWYVYNYDQKAYADSGIRATGPQGQRGSKGETGAPATLVSYAVEYLAGESGTSAPSGPWSTTVPNVAQGKYLWTRVTQTYNTGSPIVSYSVSRIGMDGSGSVASVNHISPDSAGNVALTPDNIGAEKKQKYGKLVVFGDSLGQGTNNGNYSFVDIISESGVFSDVVKACVGSATIGPYQVDSAAAGYDLVSQVDRYADDVADADIIMLEYGGNDVVAYNAGNVQMGSYSDTAETVSVCGYLTKAMERIRELNPTAKIVWLAAFWDSYDSAKNAVDAGYADAWLLFQATAIRTARQYLTGVIPIFDGLGAGDVSSDGIHPNTTGHTKITSKILANPLGQNSYPKLHRDLVLTGDVAAGTDLSLDGDYNTIYSLINAGVDVVVMYGTYGGYVMIRPVVWNSYLIQFAAPMSQDMQNHTLTSFTWNPDGTITALYQDFGISAVTGTYNADVVNTESSNVCSGVKSGHIVKVDVEITVREDFAETWGNHVLVTGFPKAYSETRAMAYFDGWTDFLEIRVTTSGTINFVIRNYSAAGKRIVGGITYITSE